MTANERDAELVARARGGDRAALAALIERHRPLVVALCRRALTDDALAEDAAQEAALEAMLGLESLRQPERFGAWFAGIGLNVARRLLRERSREHRAPLDRREVADDSREADVEAAVLAQEVQAQVHAAVAELPVGQREAVMLFYLDGLTVREAAAELDTSVAAVKVRLHRARFALRQRLFSREEIEVTTEQLVEMEVIEVRRQSGDEKERGPARHFAVLGERAGDRRVAIWMGTSEAEAIALELEAVQPPRPMAYVLTNSLLDAAGARIREVRLERLQGDTFYATVIVEGRQGTREVDARPSDAINLALRAGAPIWARPDMLDRAAHWLDTMPENERERMYGAGSSATSEVVAEIQRRWEQHHG